MLWCACCGGRVDEGAAPRSPEGESVRPREFSLAVVCVCVLRLFFHRRSTLDGGARNAAGLVNFATVFRFTHKKPYRVRRRANGHEKCM